MADKVRRGGARSALRHFLDSEAAGGLLLMAAAAAALIVANSGLGDLYRQLLHVEIGPALSPKLALMSLTVFLTWTPVRYEPQHRP